MAEVKPDYMGTREAAEEAMLAAWRRYCEAMAPFMGPAKEAKARDIARRLAEQDIVRAATAFAWHIDFDRKASVLPKESEHG